MKGGCMKKTLLSLVLSSVFIVACANGSPDFRFQTDKRYMLIGLNCDVALMDIQQPNGSTQKVFRITFCPDGPDQHGHFYKPRVYLVRKELISYMPGDSSEDGYGSVKWLSLPNMRLDGLAQEAHVIIFSDNDYIKSNLEQPCE